MRLFLGNEVDVVSPRQDARLKLKEEYNQYRNWTTVLYIAFPAVLVSLQMSGAVSRFALGLLTTLYHVRRAEAAPMLLALCVYTRVYSCVRACACACACACAW